MHGWGRISKIPQELLELHDKTSTTTAGASIHPTFKINNKEILTCNDGTNKEDQEDR